jgi:hypothetical protein
LETSVIHHLVTGQKIESWIFIITGILSIALALFFFIIIKYSFFKGLGFIFLAAGILEIAAAVFMRLPYQHIQLKDGIITNNGLLYLNEKISQMEIFLWISFVITIIGILLYSTFFRSAKTFWKGIGLGLLMQGLLLSGLFGMKHRGFKNDKVIVTQQITEPY